MDYPSITCDHHPPHGQRRAKVTCFYYKIIILNTEFLVLNAEFIIVNAKSIISNTNPAQLSQNFDRRRWLWTQFCHPLPPRLVLALSPVVAQTTSFECGSHYSSIQNIISLDADLIILMMRSSFLQTNTDKHRNIVIVQTAHLALSRLDLLCCSQLSCALRRDLSRLILKHPHALRVVRSNPWEHPQSIRDIPELSLAITLC